MTELDIISIASVRSWLSADDTEVTPDSEITRLIKTSIAWVEKYTSYRLWQRAETVVTVRQDTYLPQFPISITSVKNSDGVDQTYYTRQYALKLKVCTFCQSTIVLQVGYTDKDDIPSPLLDACYKLMTYLFENRDVYEMALPSDIQILINQYRRKLI